MAKCKHIIDHGKKTFDNCLRLKKQRIVMSSCQGFDALRIFEAQTAITEGDLFQDQVERKRSGYVPNNACSDDHLLFHLRHKPVGPFRNHLQGAGWGSVTWTGMPRKDVRQGPGRQTDDPSGRCSSRDHKKILSTPPRQALLQFRRERRISVSGMWLERQRIWSPFRLRGCPRLQ